VCKVVSTRTVTQVRSHAQKYFEKLKKQGMDSHKRPLAESDEGASGPACSQPALKCRVLSQPAAAAAATQPTEHCAQTPCGTTRMVAVWSPWTTLLVAADRARAATNPPPSPPAAALATPRTATPPLVLQTLELTPGSSSDCEDELGTISPVGVTKGTPMKAGKAAAGAPHRGERPAAETEAAHTEAEEAQAGAPDAAGSPETVKVQREPPAAAADKAAAAAPLVRRAGVLA
jgi:hypothetical protein